MTIPAQLTECDHWVIWREEVVRDRPTKVPYYVNGDLRLASTTDPVTWAAFSDAVQNAATHEMDGVGFVLTNSGFTGIDLDACRNPETGGIDEWALKIIRELNSYCEISPSGTGIKIFVRAQLSGRGLKVEYDETPYKNKRRAIEIYDSARYFTVTGQCLEGFPLTIESRDVAGLYRFVRAEAERLRKERRSSGTTMDAPRVASIALLDAKFPAFDVRAFLDRHSIPVLDQTQDGNGTKYIVECRGTHGDYDKRDGRAFVYQFTSGAISYGCLHSSCSHYSQTGNHWQELRARYERKRGLSDAIPDGKRVLVVRRGDGIEPKPIVYLWPRHLPATKLVGFYANSGEAKSPVTTDLAARVTAGLDWPDGAKNTYGPRSVLLMSSEDDAEDAIMPRFLLAGGDPSKLHVVEGAKRSEDPDDFAALVSLDSDIQLIRDYAAETPDLALIVIDPITNHLGSQNPNYEQEVRRVLMPLTALNVCTIIVGHFNRRDRGTVAQNRVMGAKAFYGVPRFVYLFGPDEESESRYGHVMVQDRGVGAESLRFETRAESFVYHGKSIPDVVRVHWLGTSFASGQDAVDPIPARQKSAESDLARALRGFLGDGPRPSSECIDHLKQHGFDPATHDPWRIRKKAGVSVEGRSVRSTWRLTASVIVPPRPKEPARRDDEGWETVEPAEGQE